jgi:hypothetical protein
MYHSEKMSCFSIVVLAIFYPIKIDREKSKYAGSLAWIGKFV